MGLNPNQVEVGMCSILLSKSYLNRKYQTTRYTCILTLLFYLLFRNYQSISVESQACYEQDVFTSAYEYPTYKKNPKH